MGTKFQETEANFDLSKAYREVQRADKDITNGKDDAAVNRLQKGYNLFTKAVGHLANAEEDAYKKAGDKIDKGNGELQKSIDDYADGKDDSGARHYADAMKCYDDALDMVN